VAGASLPEVALLPARRPRRGAFEAPPPLPRPPPPPRPPPLAPARPDHWVVYAQVVGGKVDDDTAITAVHHRKVRAAHGRGCGWGLGRGVGRAWAPEGRARGSLGAAPRGARPAPGLGRPTNARVRAAPPSCPHVRSATTTEGAAAAAASEADGGRGPPTHPQHTLSASALYPPWCCSASCGASATLTHRSLCSGDPGPLHDVRSRMACRPLAWAPRVATSRRIWQRPAPAPPAAAAQWPSPGGGTVWLRSNHPRLDPQQGCRGAFAGRSGAGAKVCSFNELAGLRSKSLVTASCDTSNATSFRCGDRRASPIPARTRP
jgi:hypothetical protein